MGGGTTGGGLVGGVISGGWVGGLVPVEGALVFWHDEGKGGGQGLITIGQ